MKKTVKLLCLAAALTVGTGSAAQAEGFKIGADVVSSYVWRGGELGDSPAIQPALSYTFPGIGVVVGAWGSYAVIENTYDSVTAEDFRYKEVDLYVTVPVGPFSFTLTDYFVPYPTNGDTFDFSSDGPNTLELSLGYSYKNLGLLGAIFVGGNDYDNAKYFEASYKFYEKNGYSAKATVGAGDEDYYGDWEGDNIALVNTGISVSKDRFTVSYVFNPDTEKSHLVFMASF
ncbi:MAG: hypothetical protein HGA70_03795 [Chlorobiaceae bacterium]|nr:hypothetical protein [Chlorobiaceae bacterium]NTW10124.1 hypothetical protein [Chlorobiaceae bacterium]